MNQRTIAHYEILEEIGAGGMGVVYRARDTHLDREVAVKVLPDEFAGDPERLARFEREAKVLASLNHPHIAAIHGLEEADGQPFLILELVEGDTLAQRITRGPIPVEEVLELGCQIAEALEAAHGQGVLHRDLKPANVKVTPEGQVKVLDFGLAKITEDKARKESASAEAETELAQEQLTTPGMAIGTIAYMSPEQVRGEELDERTDLFSLGVVLYEMATGKPPFAGRASGVIFDQILNKAPTAPARLNPEMPEGLEPILNKALEKDRELRYQSARELKVDLERLQRDRALAPASGRTGVLDPTERAGLAEAAERALSEHRWQEAFEMLSEADASGRLSAEDLERLGEAAFWTGHHDDCLRARERAFGAWVDAGEKERAALVAVQVAQTYEHRQVQTVSRAWVRRAEELVDDRPKSAARGYVLRFQACFAIEVDRDYERALEISQQVVEIAGLTGDRGLWALGTQDRGRILVQLGQPIEGIALIDEAMTAAVSGELPPEISGRTFCNMMSICETLADYRRAGEWCQAARQWSEPHAASWYPGICRVHQAELLRLRGEWAEAEQQARRTAKELARVLPEVAAEATYLIGEIQLRRGELGEAEASFQKAHELGKDPLPGLALLRLAQGRPEAAASLMDRALGNDALSPLARAKLLPARLEIGLATSDLAIAGSVADELQTVADCGGSTALCARAAAARGAFLLAGSDADSATTQLRQAWKLFLEADLIYEAARTRELLAQAYARTGCSEDATLELQAAERTFETLGAAADLDRVRGQLAEAGA